VAQHVQVRAERGAGDVEGVADVADGQALWTGLHQQAEGAQARVVGEGGEAIDGSL